MSEKKQNPWVVGVLAVLALLSVGLVVNSYLVQSSATRETDEAIERIRQGAEKY